MAKSELVVKYEIKPDDAAALLREVERLRDGLFELYRNAQTLYDNERPIAPDWLMARCVDLVGFPE